MKILASITIFCACVAAGFAGCGDDDSGESTEPGSTATEKTANGIKFESARENVGNVLVAPKVRVPPGPPPEELVVRELSHIGGVEPKPGDTVGVQYVGLNYDTGKKFVLRWGPKNLYRYRWGSEKIPRSWKLGFDEVEVGDRRELRVPADFEEGRGAHLYVIEIVEVVPR